MRRYVRFGLTAAVVSATVILALPQAAFAATFTDGTIYRPKVTENYDFTTTRRAWSAAAVYSPQQWNVSLFDGAGSWIASSTYGMGETDFIAVNSFVRPLAPYRAEATRVVGSTPAYVQWKQANSKIILPVPANDGVSGPADPDLTFAVLPSTEVLSVYDFHLSYGEAFWVNSWPDVTFYLLETNPYVPSTSVLTRSQAVVVPRMRVVGNCTLYTANHTGWHGVVMISNTAPATPVPAGGIAVALHRYDPARPTTCPHRNFPGPTPPGP